MGFDHCIAQQQFHNYQLLQENLTKVSPIKMKCRTLITEKLPVFISKLDVLDV